MADASIRAPRWPATALSLALLILVASFGVKAFSVPVADNDLWGHLHFGREILQAGLPDRNLYSYTAPDHPWINHEILAECTFAWIFDVFGPTGLVALKLGLGLVTLGLLFVTARRRTREPAAWALSLVLCASLMSWGYLVRPQIFTFLALAVVWDRLHAYAAGERAGIWALPLVFVLWVNTHGGILAGLGVFGLFVLLHRSPASERRRLATIFAASCVALLLNPYGADLVKFLVMDVLRDRPITEWASVSLFDFSNLQFKLAALLFIASVVLRAGKPLWEVTIVAFALVTAFRHERHIPLFAILLAPFLAESLALGIAWIRRWAKIDALSPAAASVVALCLTLIAGVQVAGTLRIHREVGFGIFVSPELFPVQAVRFLRENGVRGNLAVPFDWGEYVIWHLYPSIRVSIDGRYTTAYPDEVIEESWDYLEGSGGEDRVLDGATLALADRRHHTWRRLLSDDRWRVIYADDTAMMFARTKADLPEPLSPPPPLLVREAIRFP